MSNMTRNTRNDIALEPSPPVSTNDVDYDCDSGIFSGQLVFSKSGKFCVAAGRLLGPDADGLYFFDADLLESKGVFGEAGQEQPISIRVYGRVWEKGAIAVFRHSEDIPTQKTANLFLTESAARNLLTRDDCSFEHFRSMDIEAAHLLAEIEDDLRLDALEEMSPELASIFAAHRGGFLSLDGLKNLSDAAFESLCKQKGDLYLNGLTSLSDAAAESLSEHKGDLWLESLANLSDAACENLCQHEGGLFLNGLKTLSDAAAESLSKHKGHLILRGLACLSDTAAKSLATHEGMLVVGELVMQDGDLHSLLSKHPSIAADPVEWKAAICWLQGKQVTYKDLEAMADQTSIEYWPLHGRECYDDPFANGLSFVRWSAGRPITKIVGSQLKGMSEDDDESFAYSTFYFVGTIADVRSQIAALPNRVLTLELARQYVTDHSSVHLGKFGEIPADAMGVLADGVDCLELCLHTLSVEAAVRLAGHSGALHLYEAGLVITEQLAKVLGSHTSHLALYLDCSKMSPSALRYLHAVEGLQMGTASLPWCIAEDQASALASHRGWLALSGIHSLNVASAKALSAHKGQLHLMDVACLPPEVAQALSAHHGQLDLDGLTHLSDEAAYSLSQHGCDLSRHDFCKLSDDVANDIVANGRSLSLCGLTTLSDAAAESLSRHEGRLWLNLKALPKSAAVILRKHPSFADQD